MIVLTAISPRAIERVMEGFRDYAGFAARFTVLAYVVVWALLSPDTGAPAAALLCPPSASLPLCDPASLPPGLHLMGALAACIIAGEAMFSLRRAARKDPGNGAPAPIRQPAMPLQQRTIASSKVKPRNHFGLRGIPR